MGVRVTPGIGGDDVGDLPNAEGDGVIVVVLLGVRLHGAADVADLGVVEDAFEAVADLDAAVARRHDEDHEDATVCALGADLPLLFELGGELFDGLVVIKGLNGDDGDLGVGLAVNGGAEIFNLLADGGGECAGEVVDVAGGRGEAGDGLSRERETAHGDVEKSDEREPAGERLYHGFSLRRALQMLWETRPSYAGGGVGGWPWVGTAMPLERARSSTIFICS